MSPVKKINPIPPLPEREIALAALKILVAEWKYSEFVKHTPVSQEEEKSFSKKIQELKEEVLKKYNVSFSNIMFQFHVFLQKPMHRFQYLTPNTFFMDYGSNSSLISALDKLPPENLSSLALFEYYENLKKQSDITPTRIIGLYAFKGFFYSVKGHYTEDQIRLLILEDFDKERRHFEKLKTKFDEAPNEDSTYDRPRIPEKVRIEVWRRDSGKCARCGSREKLEYDHIVPISKGGSNTARNIELLCEKCNRSKSNNVV